MLTLYPPIDVPTGESSHILEFHGTCVIENVYDIQLTFLTKIYLRPHLLPILQILDWSTFK